MGDNLHLRQDFPIFTTHKELVYFDSGATAQKPQSVITAIADYYQNDTANVHRGVHYLADRSTQAFEQSRATIAAFFKAHPDELILTRNTTEAINGVAYGWGLNQVRSGDVVVVSGMEHHANLVPWQELVKRVGATLVILPVSSQGELDLAMLKTVLETQPVALVAIPHVSNVLGAVVDVAAVAQILKQSNQKQQRQTRLLVDGAQAVPHIAVDFPSLQADFYAFSGHKLYGPMGIGGLLVRKALLDTQEFQPWLFGGGMIDAVTPTSATFATAPSERFTAGTPDVASAVGLAAAVTYLRAIGMEAVSRHTQQLVTATWDFLQQQTGVTVIGPNPHTTERVGSVAFVHQQIHAHDIAQVCNSLQIAVRSGHHCAMPLHTQFQWSATTRISFGVYNQVAEIASLTQVFQTLKRLFL